MCCCHDSSVLSNAWTREMSKKLGRLHVDTVDDGLYLTRSHFFSGFTSLQECIQRMHVSGKLRSTCRGNEIAQYCRKEVRTAGRGLM
jgi:hypothetical protein